MSDQRLPMGRSLVAGNLFLLGQVLKFFFQDFKFAHEFGNVLLLLKYFHVHTLNGFVLKGNDAFKLDNSFFHELELTRIGFEKEPINRLLH